MLRVLIAVHGYPPTHAAGAERRAERTARGLAMRGYAVRVVCVETLTNHQPGIRWEDRDEHGVAVRRLYCNFREAPDHFRLSYDNQLIGSAIDELIREWKPDVVHLFSGYLISASLIRVARSYAIPIVVSLTDYWWICHRINLLRTDGTRCDGPEPVACARCHAEQRRRFRLLGSAGHLLWRAAEHPAIGNHLGIPVQIERRHTLRDLLNQVDAMIAPSRFLAQQYAHHGIDPSRIHVWRQGVELQVCRRRVPDTALRCTYLGQIKPHKGVDLLCAAWQRLRGERPRRLLLCGSDRGAEGYGRTIRDQIAQLPHAEWAGELPVEAIWQVLSETDVLVMPVRWYENSPNVILEAQAVGVPVVGARLGGVAELIDHGRNGLLFEPDNAESLAQQLQRLLDEPELLEDLRRHPIPFQHVDGEVEQIIELYGKIGVSDLRCQSAV